MPLDEHFLHDTTLVELHMGWETGICTLVIRTADSAHRELSFNDVMEVKVPRRWPWGRSVSILALRERPEHWFEIEMQSGDVIRIQAASWHFQEELAVRSQMGS